MLSHQELIELFSKGLTLQQIGDKAGVTRQRISQIYHKSLKVYFDGVGGEQRKKSLAPARRKARLKAAEEVAITTHSRVHILKKAKENGCQVSLLIYDHSLDFKEKEIMINERICAIRECARVHLQAGTTPYAKFNLSKSAMNKCEAVILLVNVPRYQLQHFIVPSAVVLEKMMSRMTTIFYIPLEPSRCHKNRTDLLEYEEAWHHLK